MADSETTSTPWQNKILPFAIALLSLLVCVFVTLYVIETKHTQDSFLASENYNAVAVINALDKKIKPMEEKLYDAELIAMLNRHYDEALVIKTRVLTLNLAFLTGMILCFMGALFVLGKFSEDPTSITAENASAKASLVSSSPGIILSVLGICLIAISIFSKTSFHSKDVPVYINPPSESSIPGEVSIQEAVDSLKIDSLRKHTITNQP